MWRSAFSVALVLWLLPGAGVAQPNTDLENLSEVAIVVEPIGSAAELKCNLTEAGIDAAMRIPLDGSRLRVARTKSSAVLVASVAAMEVGNGDCAAAVSVILFRSVVVEETGKRAIGAVWMRPGLMFHPAHDFGARVNSQVREVTTEFLGEWIKQNPKSEAAP